MATNFLNLWILARVAQTAVGTGLCLAGAVLGRRLVRRWQPDQSREQQLVLERQAELVASVMQVALILGVLGLGLAVHVSDHLVGGIRGAMCAFGVLASTRTGFYGLLASSLTAAACALWVGLHRFDLRLRTPVLTRRKFAWLLPVGALALGDLALVVTFAGQLDFKVVASCSSVWVDAAMVPNSPVVQLLAPVPAGLLGAGAAAAAAVARRADQCRGLAGAVLLRTMHVRLLAQSPGRRRPGCLGDRVLHPETAAGEPGVFVAGSDVTGPMGRALVPIAGREAAEQFLKDHHGSRIYTVDEITAEVLREIAGRAPEKPAP